MAVADETTARSVVETSAASGRPVLFEAKGVAAGVEGRTLWSDVDLTLAAGQFMAVLGPNGVGKTTLLKVILGLMPSSAGSLRVLGKPPGQENHRIGYLPQRRTFDPDLRIRGIDIVRLGLDGDRWGVPLPGARVFSAKSRAREAHVAEVIELVGASHYARRPIGRISGGEQQRLLIAQALVRDPVLLLLDEPLDGLDLPSQASVTSLISRICRERGIGTIMAAHDVNPLLAYLDLVAYIGAGSIVAGNPEAVITTGTLSKLYGSRVDVVRTADGSLAVLGQPEVRASCHGSPADGQDLDGCE
jgi:zinc/manganese transport system ATP-binding protein